MRKGRIALAIAGAIALAAVGLVVALARGGESLELPPPPDEDVAERARTIESLDAEGACPQIISSPSAWDAMTRMKTSPVRGGTCRARLEALLRETRAAEPRALVRLRRRFDAVLGKRPTGLVYRVHAGRVFVRFADEPCPAGFREIADADAWVSIVDPEPMLVIPAGVCCYADGLEARVERPFLCDVHRVTVERYARFLDHVARDGHATCPEDEPRDKDHRPTGWSDKLPRDAAVGDVDRWDARAFAAWAGKRLPTVNEWVVLLQDGRNPYGLAWSREMWEWKIDEGSPELRSAGTGIRCVADWPR